MALKCTFFRQRGSRQRVMASGRGMGRTSCVEVAYLWPHHIVSDRSATIFQRPIGLTKQFAVHLLTRAESQIPPAIETHISLHRAPTGRAASSQLRYLLFSLRWLARHRSHLDAVYTSDGATIFCGWVAQRFLRIRWLAEFWDHPYLERNYAWQNGRRPAALWYHLRSLIANRLVRRATAIVCTGNAGMLRGLRIAPNKLVVSPNGADPALFRPARPVRRTGKLEVVYVGWIGRARGTKLMFDAMERLQWANASVRLTLVGPIIPRDRQWVLYLQRRLANSVLLTGRLPHPEVVSILKRSVVGLYPFPATEELEFIHPIKVCEYMAMGVVPVCTDLTGVRDLLRDGVDGFLLKSADASALAAFLHLAASDRNLIEKMSANARTRAYQFRWDRIHTRLNAQLAARLGVAACSDTLVCGNP